MESETLSFSLDQLRTFETCREHIYPKVVSRRRNADLLSRVPHRCFLDLAMAWYYRIDPSVLPNACALIRKEEMTRWGICEEVLCETAFFNTRRDRPLQIIPMSELFAGSGPVPMYVATAEDGFFGAAALFVPGAAKCLSKYFPGDLYLLPSSVHEMILVPYFPDQEEEYEEIVKSVNSTVLAPEEILSDRVYHFHREMGVITLGSAEQTAPEQARQSDDRHVYSIV